MFCPKCGTQNSDTGRFCRKCGVDLGNVSEALAERPSSAKLVDRKGKPISYEQAIVKTFTGIAFLIVSIVLAFSSIGRGWWFWMLIPAFSCLGAGIAQYVQLREYKRSSVGIAPMDQQAMPGGVRSETLPPPSTEFVPAAESRYKTGELVPPSVTEGTTRHLEVDKEGETMTLPKM